MSIPESFSGNRIETYQGDDGKWGWKIWAEENILAGCNGYEDESSLLQGLFSVFFGSYDESFLAAHKRWVDGQKISGEEAPEPYVRQSKGNQDGTGNDRC